MTKQEKLDLILKYMSDNMAEIPTRPDNICKNANLSISQAEAFLMFDMMAADGYIKRQKPEIAAYIILFKGIVFM